MNRNWMVRALAIGFVALATRGAVAQQVSDAQNKLLAKRAAEADAYRKLGETINGFQLSSQTFVKDFVTESDEIRAGMDTFIRGARFGQPRYYDDGVCEIEAEVTVAQLITTIKELHTRHYKGNSVTGTDIEQFQQALKTDVVKATGTGAPRPDLPPELPAGVEANLTQVEVTTTTLYVPPIWKSVSAQERLMAQRAAHLDAARKLLERIKGLRLTSNTLVKDFVTEYDEISTASEGIVVGAKQKGPAYFHDGELIVEVTLEVPVQSVITQLKELHTRHYKGNSVTGTDIEQLTKILKTDMFEATGTGTVRPQAIQQVVSAGFEMPAWVAETISAVGEGTDPAIDTPQGRLKAARAAELDAKRKLSEQVFGLRIDSNTLVRDFVTEHDEISTQVNAVLIGAVANPPSFGNGIAQVKVILPAAEVWRVVHQQITIVERRN